MKNKKIVIALALALGLVGLGSVQGHAMPTPEDANLAGAEAGLRNEEFREDEDVEQAQRDANWDKLRAYEDEPKETYDQIIESHERPLSEIYPNGHWDNEDDSTGPVGWKRGLIDDTTGGKDTIGYNPETDVNHSYTAPRWLRGYWKSNTAYQDNGSYYEYQELGVGKNKYGFSHNQGYNNYLFNSADGMVGIHKISHNLIYCYSKARDTTGYWSRINKSQYYRDSTAGSNDSSSANVDFSRSTYVRVGRKDARDAGLRNKSNSFYDNVGHADLSVSGCNGKKAALSAAWWMIKHGLVKALRDNIPLDIPLDESIYDDPSISNILMNKKPFTAKKNRRGHNSRIHLHKDRNRHKKHIIVTQSKFKRSNSKYRLRKSGFKALNKVFGAKFIFNKYAPTDARAVIPKHFNLRHLGWIQGKFGAPKHKLIFYRQTKHGWIKIK